MRILKISQEERLIELDELLNGAPLWKSVVNFWKSGEFYEEHYLVEAIEKWLLTDEQRQSILDAGLTIEKMLNGRYNGNQKGLVYGIYNEWNNKLGFKAFGD